ncbi:MAG TPA: hypothetical protein VK974_00795 [Methylophilaceae bacterium]|nr:hypothetical protein [Methylophilaceae bacterium]
MAIREPDNLAVMDDMRSLARSIDAAKHGQQGAVIKAAADKYGWSIAKVYRHLMAVGWKSGRKVRADRGTTKQSLETMQDISALLKIGVRKNGKATMQIPNAVSVLSQNGREINVSNGRMSALLRDRNLHLGAQRLATAAQPTQSLHPNHVHQVDPSLCLLYYLPNGQQHIIRDDQLYKNKLETVAKIKLKIWRYVLTDHNSATIIVRYYQSAGESQANLYDFLLYAWQKMEGRLFHGVPKILLWDKGSANTAGAIKNALHSLDVNAIEHMAGNPRAKGSVENGNNLVECLFESRLRYEPVENVDQLNAAVEGWYNAYNSNTIPNYDSRLKRKYMTSPQVRYGLWQMIRKEQLRLLPDIRLCRMLLSGTDVIRKVTQELTVSYNHPVSQKREHYDVSEISGIFIKQEVKISPMVYGDGEVMITFSNYKGEETCQILKPIQADGVTGFRMDAPVIGEEYKSQPDTVIETAGKAAQQQAYPGKNQEEIEKAKSKNAVPFDGTFDAHSHLSKVASPAFMNKPGQMMNVPDRLHVESKILSLIETKVALRNRLGRAVTAAEDSMLRAAYPGGVKDDAIDEVLALLANADTAPRLVAVR